MEAVTIIETSKLEQLLSTLHNLDEKVCEMYIELKELKKPLFTVKELCEYLGKGSTWVDAHKADIGFSMAGGEIRFKRKDVEAYLESTYYKRK